MYSLFQELVEDVWEEMYQMEKETQPRYQVEGNFCVRIYVKGIGLGIKVVSQTPENLLLIAHAITKTLRENDMEPTVELQP